MYECLDEDRMNQGQMLDADALAALSAEHSPDMMMLNDPSSLSPPITTYPVSQRSQ